MLTLRQADAQDLDTLVPLVESYRRFYRQPPDTDGVRHFLAARFAKGDAHLLLAFEHHRAVGFVQLFPVPSTNDLAPRWILNDLYVDPDVRRRGTGTALLEAARELAAAHGVPKLMLRTQVDNAEAQSRYRALGWQRDDAFDTYLLSVTQ
ncbi:GNAT family N-acetyltransferase [Salinicola avicenniae]|uniref:GNAT family N-acetyltransferase n=1 Tax=Salinicola avicenniae TaxID=2916836 RepID=UPI00207379D3|nr:MULTISPECIES: GNAT family N-acetyltransferase [unclassified Salinicola]